jgi:hypothetical protein
MRHVFAHQAMVMMDRDADLRAPGGAITVALCGLLDHEPPCPLAAHHTCTERVEDQVRVRTLFAAATDDEQTVRQSINDALSAGQFQGPDRSLTRWRLLTSGRSHVHSAERDPGALLANPSPTKETGERSVTVRCG